VTFIPARQYSHPRKGRSITSNSRIKKVTLKHPEPKFYSWVEAGKLCRLRMNRDGDRDELLKIINLQNEKR